MSKKRKSKTKVYAGKIFKAFVDKNKIMDIGKKKNAGGKQF